MGSCVKRVPIDCRMIPKELFATIRRLEIRTKGLVSNIFGGEYHSAFKGQGMEFAEVRPYQIGDDIRAIDWNVSARNDETYVKIFEEGEKGDKFYLILEGAIRISRFVPGMGEEALAVLREGAYFGEMSLIDDDPRSATALAHEKSRVFVVKRRDLEDLLFVDRDLAYELLWNMVRTITKRLRATNDKMTFLATSNKF